MFWDPFDGMEREMRNIFAGFFPKRVINHNNQGKDNNQGKELAKWQNFRPAITDCYETENSVVACFELPGANKNDIELNVTDDYVEVKVEKKQETERTDKKKGHYLYESSASQFYRRIPLPTSVDADEAKAEYKNGMLKVEIPKKEGQEQKKRKIEIK